MKEIDESDAYVKELKDFRARIVHNVCLDRHIKPDGTFDDYDYSCIDFTIGSEWGNHLDMHFDGVKELLDFIQFLQQTAESVHRTESYYAQDLPEDWNPTRNNWT